MAAASFCRGAVRGLRLLAATELLVAGPILAALVVAGLIVSPAARGGAVAARSGAAATAKV